MDWAYEPAFDTENLCKGGDLDRDEGDVVDDVGKIGCDIGCGGGGLMSEGVKVLMVGAGGT